MARQREKREIDKREVAGENGMSEKLFSCYFVKELFVRAKDEHEARDKSWKLMMAKTNDLLNLEYVTEIDEERSK